LLIGGIDIKVKVWGLIEVLGWILGDERDISLLLRLMGLRSDLLRRLGPVGRREKGNVIRAGEGGEGLLTT